jgi:hypothetical protein
MTVIYLIRPYRLVRSRTPGSHPGNPGSNPGKVTFRNSIVKWLTFSATPSLDALIALFFLPDVPLFPPLPSPFAPTGIL